MQADTNKVRPKKKNAISSKQKVHFWGNTIQNFN